ncbi:MAG: NUDIX hydrolase [Eubacterium sp.]|jgi:ADP-ribose pyrophosphatase|nr:NUDIX hydrolase [Eubacterium sp.]
MNERYNVVNTERTELGRFAIRLDMVEKDGREYPFSFVQSGDSVAVLAETEGRIVLVHQYRHSIRQNVLEIPGGSVETDGNPEETARRELLEETGYEAKHIMLLGVFYPSPGSSSEKCWLYHAVCSICKVQQLEPLECMNVVLVDKKELECKIRMGEFVHGMGLAAWLMYRLAGEEC